MLKIGFATEFFTLWDVSSEVMYTTNMRGEHHASYEKVSYYYMQNLSKDEASAIKKAKERGCTILEVDNELFGRNNSFSKEIKLSSELRSDINPFFTYGKYTSQAILECTDIKYLAWYFGETSNRYAKQILLDNNYYEVNGQVLDIEAYNRHLSYIESRKETDLLVSKIEAAGEMEIDFIMLQNPRRYEKLSPTDCNIDVVFDDVQEMHYKGMDYYLPVIGGKARRIKNKSIKAIVRIERMDIQDEITPVLKIVKLIK